ncbi:MAG TPA: amidohydrolase [Bacteroidales bacterium]|nr:amidohydrolase [Bacteroidales bacterium]
MNELTISLVQTDLVWENPEANLNQLNTMLDSIRRTDIIILPELFTTGFTMRCNGFAETMNGFTIHWMKEVATSKNAAVCGSIIIQEGTCFYNRFLFVTPDNVYSYDKHHLFSIASEDKFYSKGSQRVIINYRNWRIMPLICYDIRFPVWSRNRNDYDMLIYVASWPASRRKIWDALVRARALENQCVVAAVNRVGVDGAYIYYNGGTQLIDARGDTIAMARDNHEEIFTTTLDKQKLDSFREKFPVWKDADPYYFNV